MKYIISFNELISIGVLNKYLIFDKKNHSYRACTDVFPPSWPIVYPTS